MGITSSLRFGFKAFQRTFTFSEVPEHRTSSPLQLAIAPVLESLEGRQLFAGVYFASFPQPQSSTSYITDTSDHWQDYLGNTVSPKHIDFELGTVTAGDDPASDSQPASVTISSNTGAAIGPTTFSTADGHAAEGSVIYVGTHLITPQWSATSTGGVGITGYGSAVALDLQYSNSTQCSAASGRPVFYSSGAASMPFNDFLPDSSPVLRVGRSWSNISFTGSSQAVSFGNGMSFDALPYLVDQSSLLVYAGYSALVNDPRVHNDALFSVMDGSNSAFGVINAGGKFVISGGAKDKPESFSHDLTTNTISRLYPNGMVDTYADFSNSYSSGERGQLLSRTMPSGERLQVNWANGAIDGMSWWSGGDSTQSPNSPDEGYSFSYATGTNQVTQAVQLRDGVPVRTVTYQYYGSGDGNGNAGDLKYVITRNGDSNAAIVQTNYYRWYTSDSATGYTGGLQVFMGDEAYRKAVRDLGSPSAVESAPAGTTAANDLSNYADNYFEYTTDPSDASIHRVSLEIAMGSGQGCSCGKTGEGKYTFTYQRNTTATDFSGNNVWAMRTTETLPDNHQNIVYTNGNGDIIFKVLWDTTNNKSVSSWFRYDSDGHVVMQASGNAITTYDAANPGTFEQYGDLVGYGSSGTHLKSDGRVDVTNYFSSSDTTDASLYNYQKSIGYQIGDDPSTFAPTEAWSYTDAGRGDGIWNVLSDTVYAAVGGTAGQRVTNFAYSWYQVGTNDTAQIKSVATTLAAISTSQNGSGASNTTTSYFDSAGRVIWYVDGSGYINYFEYDPLTGAKTKEIDDVDPSTIAAPAVAGPVRANGLPAALNLTTTIVVDSQGRKTKVTDPNGNVLDSNGNLTDDNGNITYTVYDDTTADGDPRKVITYTGWNATTHQPTGPVWATIDDPATGTKDTISYTYSATGGLPVDANGAPTGAEWDSTNFANITIQSLVRQKRNVSDQVVEEDTYTNLNGLTYDPTAAGWSSLGTAGTNYLSTKYKYDSGARLYQTTTPDGTITMSVFDARGLVQSMWKGTDNTGATESDPTGGSSAGNNMVEIDSYTYDDDGNQLTATQHADASTVYTTTYQYDFRDRLTDARGPDGVASHFVLDNLGEQTETDTYADLNGNFIEDPGEEIGKSTDTYDDQGQVYRSSVYQNSRALDSGALTSTGTTATVKLANHGFSSGQSVTIAGASQSACDGTFTITVVDANTFTFTIPASAASPATGSRISVTANKSLTTNYWYDARGNQVKTQDPSGLITKTFYDGAGRVTRTDTTADPAETASGTYADALTLTGDQVIEQNDYYLDASGRTRITTNWRRDGAEASTTTGAPTANNYDHSSVAYFYDLADRVIATADYGRDGAEAGASSADALVWNQTGASYKDSDGDGIPNVVDHPDGFDPGPDNYTAPSDTVYKWIYTGYSYDAAGRLEFTTDNANRRTETLYDFAGRTTATIANYTGDGSAGGTSTSDENLTTEYTYDNLGQLVTQATKVIQANGDFTNYEYTDYQYTDNVDHSLITTTAFPGNTVLVNPNGPNGPEYINTDAILTTYDRMGRKITDTDQRGVVHAYTYDSAGRLSSDSIGTGTLSSGVDGAVRTIQYTYDDQARVSTVSSLDVSGNTVNQLAYTYDAWGNVTQDAEAHDGVVGSTTPTVQYVYSDGSGTSSTANYVRLNKTLYPKNNGGSVGTFVNTYETSDIGKALNRVGYIDDGNGTHLVQYTWVGLSERVNMILHPQVSGGLEMNDGSKAGHYAAFDRYNRFIKQQWQKNDGSINFEQRYYTYDRMGNRLSMNSNGSLNGVSSAGANNWDETYSYDGLNRLVTFNRGTYSGGTIASPKFQQTWTLDSLGNWAGYTQTNNDTTLLPGVSTFSQTRTANVANQITSTSGGGFAGTNYDAAGNQTAGPKTGAESTQIGYVYDGWNRLVGVDANHDGDLYDAGDVRYRYDGTGRRITKFTDNADDGTNASGSTEEYYQNEQNQVLEVRTGTVTGGVKTINANPKERYLWDANYIDEPAMVELDTNTDGTRDYRLWPTTDANHNVTGLLSDKGVTVERYAYTPYGERIVLNGDQNYANTGPDADGAEYTVDTNGSDYGFLLGFQGLRLDPESGGWEADYRTELPAQGTWNQRDPIGTDAYPTEGMNLDQFVHSNPTNENDPEGLKTVGDWGPEDALNWWAYKGGGEGIYVNGADFLNNSKNSPDFQNGLNNDVYPQIKSKAARICKSLQSGQGVGFEQHFSFPKNPADPHESKPQMAGYRWWGFGSVSYSIRALVTVSKDAQCKCKVDITLKVHGHDWYHSFVTSGVGGSILTGAATISNAMVGRGWLYGRTTKPREYPINWDFSISTTYDD